MTSSALRRLKQGRLELLKTIDRFHTTHFLFGKQELAHFPSDQRFVYYEHVVVRVMQFNDLRVLDA
jgi:hypothetical protein